MRRHTYLFKLPTPFLLFVASRLINLMCSARTTRKSLVAPKRHCRISTHTRRRIIYPLHAKAPIRAFSVHACVVTLVPQKLNCRHATKTASSCGCMCCTVLLSSRFIFPTGNNVSIPLNYLNKYWLNRCFEYWGLRTSTFSWFQQISIASLRSD